MTVAAQKLDAIKAELKTEIAKAKWDTIKTILGIGITGTLGLLAIQTTVIFYMLKPLLSALP